MRHLQSTGIRNRAIAADIRAIGAYIEAIATDKCAIHANSRAICTDKRASHTDSREIATYIRAIAADIQAMPANIWEIAIYSLRNRTSSPAMTGSSLFMGILGRFSRKTTHDRCFWPDNSPASHRCICRSIRTIRIHAKPQYLKQKPNNKNPREPGKRKGWE